MAYRFLAAVVGTLALAPLAAAQADVYRLPIEREVSSDIAGGHYQFYEDADVSAGFREAGAVLWAEFQIIEAHRTEKFGSGVAFLFFDQNLDRFVRVAFGDKGSETNIVVGADVGRGWGREDDNPFRSLHKSTLAIPKTSGARVSFRNDGKQGVVLKVGRTETPLKLGFDPAHVVVQIYCADAWVRFPEQEAIS